MEDENWGTRRKTSEQGMLPSRCVSSQILPAYVYSSPPPPHPTTTHLTITIAKQHLNDGENPDGRPAPPPKEKQSHKDAIFSANGYYCIVWLKFLFTVNRICFNQRKNEKNCKQFTRSVIITCVLIYHRDYSLTLFKGFDAF